MGALTDKASTAQIRTDGGNGQPAGPTKHAGPHGQPGKPEPDPARPRHIITEPGMGYRFVA